MTKTVFASDLDNTLIYSRKHVDSTKDFHCIEYLEGKEQGFLSKKSAGYLRDICAGIAFLPVTTRSIAQYRRIQWPTGCRPELALVANGAILLEHGEVDLDWQKESQEQIKGFASELEQLQERLSLTEEFHRCRMVDDSYLFIPFDSVSDLTMAQQKIQEMTALSIQASGRKLYALPPGMDKGSALRRLKKKFSISKVISAGDSTMDIPMLQQADIAFSPSNLSWNQPTCTSSQKFVYREENGGRFSDYILQMVSHMLENLSSITT